MARAICTWDGWMRETYHSLQPDVENFTLLLPGASWTLANAWPPICDPVAPSVDALDVGVVLTSDHQAGRSPKALQGRGSSSANSAGS
jgi:hypothetical protein